MRQSSGALPLPRKEMIDRLAQISLRVGKRLAGFPHHQAYQRSAVGLEQVCGAVEDRGAGLAADRIPRMRRGLGRGQRLSMAGGSA